MATSRRSSRGRVYRFTEEVLNELFTIPTDSESEDDLESDSNTADDIEGSPEPHVDTVCNEDGTCTASDGSDTYTGWLILLPHLHPMDPMQMKTLTLMRLNGIKLTLPHPLFILML